MAVKIVRQTKEIVLIGAPSSAAAFAPGLEKAPAALRASGLVGRLQAIGYKVTDYGDCAPRLFAEDDEHPRARNAAEVVAGLNDLRPRVEQAIKTGALVLVLGGECVQSLAVVAGARRYHKHVNLIWVDRDADLNTPASTPSGRLDGMAVAHFLGLGAAELVRFWGEPPLVREPDILLFGVQRLDPPEREFLDRSAMRRVLAEDAQKAGVAWSARYALERMHADERPFVLHFDVDVMAQEDFPAVPVPGSGGLSAAEVREALQVLLQHRNLLALDVSQFNPDQDAAGRGAEMLVGLLVDALAGRFAALNSPPEPAAEPSGEPSTNHNGAESVS